MTDEQYKRRAAFYAAMNSDEEVATKERLQSDVTRMLSNHPDARDPEKFGLLADRLVEEEIESAYQDHLALVIGAVRMEDEA